MNQYSYMNAPPPPPHNQTQAPDPTAQATQPLPRPPQLYNAKQQAIANLFQTSPQYPAWWNKVKALRPSVPVDEMFLTPSADALELSCDQAYTIYCRGYQQAQIDTQKRWTKTTAAISVTALLLGFTTAFITVAYIVGNQRDNTPQQASRPADNGNLVIQFEGQ